MAVKEFINLVISLLKNWQVDITIVGGLFVIWAVNSILSYKKRPKKVKAKKSVAEKPKEQPEKKEPEAEGAAEEAVGE